MFDPIDRRSSYLFCFPSLLQRRNNGVLYLNLCCRHPRYAIYETLNSTSGVSPRPFARCAMNTFKSNPSSVWIFNREQQSNYNSHSCNSHKALDPFPLSPLLFRPVRFPEATHYCSHGFSCDDLHYPILTCEYVVITQSRSPRLLATWVRCMRSF